MKRNLLFIFLAVFATAGCTTTKVKGNLEKIQESSIHRVAVLPVKFSGDMARERVDTLYKLTERELENKGYVLLDDQIVERVCTTPECSERSKLISSFGADGFVELTFDSVARTNFLAGYVNSVSGNLKVFGKDGTELVMVSHTQSEKGGLLFNTGQLAQAVISTTRNAEADRGFGLLAALYAKEIVAKLPAVNQPIQTAQGQGAKIISTNVVPGAGGIDQVCLKGTPQSSANLVFRRVRSNLRETSPGEYCGFFRLADLNGTEAELELRSPYGDIDRRKLPQQIVQTCQVRDNVELEKSTGRLKVNCSDPGTIGKFIVYRAASEQGPYEKVGEFMGASWTIPGKQFQPSVKYAVVAVSKRGERTSPVLVKS